MIRAATLALVVAALVSSGCGREVDRQPALATGADSVFTLYLLGGSTALGEPYAPRVDLGRIAALLFDGRLAGRPLRVANLAGQGKTAAGAVPDARRVARRRHPPGTAAAFLYLGNNEFLGFDRRHDLRKSERSLFDVPVLSATERTAVLERYRASVASIIDLLRASGVTVVVGTAAVDMKDWRPNRSVLAHPANADSVRAHLARGERRAAAGDWSAARDAYLRALTLEPDFALAAYRLGDCAREMADLEEARRCYQHAIDTDGNPYRETSPQQEIVRTVAAARGVPVVDCQAILAAASPQGIVGSELLWDNCHPRLEGYVLLARGYATALAAALGSPPPRALDAKEVGARLGIDRDFERQVLHGRAQYFYAAATLTWDPSDRLARARAALDEAAIMGPPDAGITCSQAILAAIEGDRERSLELWQAANRLDPKATRERAANRHVLQIMQRRGVADLAARLDRPDTDPSRR